ncbi:Mobile element protein [Candidatus Enterovibrio altilux]|uniref:Mobile element protein n=1 Tax=Candidatus Enterovibrio altilux TaxID=1927128 RepID=A0A291BBD1_9GAMM|nr:Mobile element protein [Candidatus Enterovibrio luxaltus]
MALVVKCVFSILLKSLQGFINSIFKLAQLPFSCPHYSCISKRTKTVNVAFKTKIKGVIQHLAIAATGLKIYGEGKEKIKKHDTNKKLLACHEFHIAININTHACNNYR